ncbi:Repressor of filamentous growth 1 [Hypsizygus marmoreus]|uniref:Repressor of filamentous growth 1 n=1 Tax=Hypsizygus marmoreus TaxID=39966 RepID=A0A369K6I3_HYPMA|nr:Repressor of filamentous growth 1 [Hypsizygus marmoreus]
MPTQNPSGQFLQFQCTTSTDYETTLDYDFFSTPPSSHSLIPTNDELNTDDFEPAVYGFPMKQSFTDSLPPSLLYGANAELQKLPVRKPATRLRSGNRVPRPRNAFMIFRSELWAEKKITKTVERDHRHISRIIGHCWNQLPESQKDLWRRKAEQEKIQHGMKYPGYRFSPTTRAKKPIKRNVKRNGNEELLRCKKVAELLLEGKQGIELDSAVKGLGPPPEEVEEATKQPAPGASSSSKRQGSRNKARAALSAHSEPPVFRSPLLPPAEAQVVAASTTLQYQPQPAATPSSSAYMDEYSVQHGSTYEGMVPPPYQTAHDVGAMEVSYQSQQQGQFYSQWYMPTASDLSNNMGYANSQAAHYHNEHTAAPSYHAYPPASISNIQFFNPFSYTAQLPTSVVRTTSQRSPSDPLHWDPTEFHSC